MLLRNGTTQRAMSSECSGLQHRGASDGLWDLLSNDTAGMLALGWTMMEGEAVFWVIIVLVGNGL